MNWIQELIGFVSVFVIGLFSGLLWPLLREKITERRKNKKIKERKRQILKDLDNISSDIMAAVRAEPHGVQNKDKWVARLLEFAKQYEELIGPLTGSVKRLAYKIEDSTFDHGKPCDPPYCCNEVIIDLTLLKLCILPLIAEETERDVKMIEEEEREHLRRIWEIFQEIVMPQALDEWHETIEEEWYSEWKNKNFKVTETLAMANYVNKERQEL